MAFVSSNSDQFCDDFDRVIFEEENFMNLIQSGNENINNDPDPIPELTTTTTKRKKPYQRYSPEQIKRLQEVFDQKSHPYEDERKALGQEIGLDPLRVKFWFQNRRSQTKKKTEKDANTQLKDENDKLRTENELCKLALLSATCCQNCDGPSPGDESSRVELLRAENDFLKEKIFRVTSLMENYCGKGILSYTLNSVAVGGSKAADLGFSTSEAQPEFAGENVYGWYDQA